MSLLLRSRPRYSVAPEQLTIDWSHPLAHGLVRAYSFAGASHGLVEDLCGRGSAPMTLGSLVEEAPGRVWRATTDAEMVTLAPANNTPPEMSPAIGQGFSVWALVLFENADLNQVAHKAGAGGYEWLLGRYSNGLMYGMIWDGTNANYTGRNAPGPSSNVWHTCALAWNGDPAANAGNVRLYTDGRRVDDTEYSAGTVVTITPTGQRAVLALNSPAIGGTTGIRFALVALWRRGLLPDELAWLAEDPYAFLTVPRPVASFTGAPAPAPSHPGSRLVLLGA
jgi:hypothetical protein